MSGSECSTEDNMDASRLTPAAGRRYDRAHFTVIDLSAPPVPLLLNNREVAAAMRAHEYVETMEEAFRELGAGRAVNTLRADTCVPLDRYTPAIRRAAEARIDALPLDADPVYAAPTMAAAKEA